MAVNERLLRQVIASQGGQKIASRANEAIRLNFAVQKETFLRAFDNDDVTREIDAGPHAASSIPELKAVDGNLFSLIGFKEGQDPIPALRNYLDKTIKVDVNSKRVVIGSDGRIRVDAPVTIPTLEEIYDATESNRQTTVPWNAGKSFVKMIQRGVEGFGSYISGMFDTPKPSRSGGGVQTKKPIRDVDLPGIPYLNRLLDTFKKSLSRKK